ncbi:hypothetical protein [Desulfosarcina ovata]|uniref:N-acetyltransferase domain-containing protein n=1 Tax=Desulfosarcina ovata subsp. ovata TaxID=2752305 RepID=A0A5K8AFP3_9BACT|nr:hypothetical protein [Desulfosarcina ovata]BBO91338.1 hypothetical protein DSCOOX_45180 [Desulfosarcina ovata subsp. ovata]
MSIEQTPGADVEPGQAYTIDRFTSADAEGVASLFRSVYGSGYPVKTYLEPNLLIRENEALRTISSVARTARGKIVGHNALYNSAAHPGTYESGAGVVHAAFRGGKGIFTEMVAHGLDLAKTLPAVNLVFGEPVCNHPYSQKLTMKMNFISRALEVDLMPAAAYRKEGSASGRVAAFLDFRTFRKKSHAVFLPRCYRTELDFLYAGLDDQREFRPAESPVPSGSVTDLRPQIFDYAGVARIAVHATGADFRACLDQLEKDLAEKGIVVTQMWLNLGEAWVGEAVEILRSKKYFLGGVLQRWFDTDGLLMQKIRKIPDWDGICMHADRHRQIFGMVQADWQRTHKE